MNLCFSTLGCTEKSLDEILDLCLKYEIGFLEIRGMGGILDNRQIPDFAEERISETAEKFRIAGVKPLVIGTSCTFHNHCSTESALAEGLASLKIAGRLGAKYVRVFGDKLTEDGEECTSLVISGLRSLADEAEKRGLRILLEVHGEFNTIEALSPIIEALGTHNGFGLIWDIEHSHRACGFNWKPFMERIFPYIYHVHIKDTDGKALVAPGDGEIPIPAICDELAKHRYDGAFSLEWERKWHPELATLESVMPKFLLLMKR